MSISRRNLLSASGGLMAVGIVRPPVMPKGAVLTLIDPTLSAAALAKTDLQAGADLRPLAANVVRQWRDGLGRDIARAGGATAYVRWDKALLIGALAREAAMQAAVVRHGQAVFVVNIQSRFLRSNSE